MSKPHNIRTTKPSLKQFELNAKWTSAQELHGWRHFRVCSRRQGADGLEVEIMAVADRSVRFWLPRRAMLDPDKWWPGWVDLSDMAP